LKKNRIILFYIFILSTTIVCSEESKLKQKEKKQNNYTIAEELVTEVKSNYSHIRVKDYGSLRQLYFVRDNGYEALESTIDIHYPQNLFLLYTQTMFASFLINKEHKDTLLVGLGGGGMVHFLNFYFPSISLDVVEIDPIILELAKKYFYLKNHPSTKISIDDATNFISNTNKKYDVIFMDAFLKPSNETDSTGVSVKLKTVSFFQNLKSHLKKNGIVVFNINTHDKIKNDVETILSEFPQVYFFQKDRSGNLIVIGSTDSNRISQLKMSEIAKDLDKNHKVNFSFSDLASYYREKFE